MWPQSRGGGGDCKVDRTGQNRMSDAQKILGLSALKSWGVLVTHLRAQNRPVRHPAPCARGPLVTIWVTHRP